MNLLYKSTRNSDKTVTASQAILKGLADDGGLFVPVSVPKLDVTMDELKDMSYQETAYAVMFLQKSPHVLLRLFLHELLKYQFPLRLASFSPDFCHTHTRIHFPLLH